MCDFITLNHNCYALSYIINRYECNLTAERAVSPADRRLLLGTVPGEGGEDGALAGVLRAAAAHFTETQTHVRLSVHHIMTRLQHTSASASLQRATA